MKGRLTIGCLGKDNFLKIDFVIINVYVCAYACVFRCSGRPERESGFPGARVTGGWEPSDIGAGI